MCNQRCEDEEEEKKITHFIHFVVHTESSKPTLILMGFWDAHLNTIYKLQHRRRIAINIFLRFKLLQLLYFFSGARFQLISTVE
jgi:hypothetical protein